MEAFAQFLLDNALLVTLGLMVGAVVLYVFLIQPNFPVACEHCRWTGKRKNLRDDGGITFCPSCDEEIL